MSLRTPLGEGRNPFLYSGNFNHTSHATPRSSSQRRSQSLPLFRAFQPACLFFQLYYMGQSQSLPLFRAFQLPEQRYKSWEELIYVAIPSFIQGISTLIVRGEGDYRDLQSQSLPLFRAFQQTRDIFWEGEDWNVAIPSFIQGIST